jgi:hypothetical protein
LPCLEIPAIVFQVRLAVGRIRIEHPRVLRFTVKAQASALLRKISLRMD